MKTKLYVGNLPLAAEINQLHALFGASGRQVTSIRILSDRITGRSRGFGFVEMGSPEDAQSAIEALNGHDFMGRSLRVNEAHGEKPQPDPDYGNQMKSHRHRPLSSRRGPYRTRS